MYYLPIGDWNLLSNKNVKMGAEVALLPLKEHLKKGGLVYGILIDRKSVEDYVSKRKIFDGIITLFIPLELFFFFSHICLIRYFWTEA